MIYIYIYIDTLAEWLRRRPAKPLGSARTGSNPVGVDKFILVINTQICADMRQVPVAQRIRRETTNCNCLMHEDWCLNFKFTLSCS